MDVKTSGNGASVQIPAAVTEAAPLRLDQPADMPEGAGKAAIEPVQEVAHDVSTLVAGMTDENRHEAIEIGPAIGREAW